jgi:formylglycine-generating enzyme required for sulfatase activity/uncharacterized caspase-like protein
MGVIRQTIMMLVALLLTSAGALAEQRIALVIGNSAYANARLANPVNDAQLISRALRQHGFQVIQKLDAGEREMGRAVKAFGESLEAAGRDAVGLFYYAGHGVQVGGINYLIPVDADIEDEEDVPIEAVSADHILGIIEASGNRLNLMFLDACRNNPFLRTSRNARHGLAMMNAPTGIFIGYATAPGDVAKDGSGTNSPFTTAMAATMGQPGEPIESMFKRVRLSVIAATEGEQTPWSASSLTGDFSFVPGAAVVAEVELADDAPDPAPVPSTDRSALDLAFWDAIKDSDDRRRFQAYLEQYPEGAFAAIARLRLEELSETEVAVVTPPPEPAEPMIEIEPLGSLLVALSNANARGGPSTDFYQVGRLSAGEEVTVTGKVRGQDWYRVALADGSEAYVWAPLLGEPPEPAPRPATEETEAEPNVDAADLPLPSHSFSVATIARGDNLSALLADAGAEKVDIVRALIGLRKVHNPNRLTIGQRLVVEITGSIGEAQLVGFTLQSGRRSAVIVERDGESFQARKTDMAALEEALQTAAAQELRLANLPPEEGQAIFAEEPAPRPAADPSLVMWVLIEDSDRAADFESFLAQYPTSPMARSARDRLAALRQVAVVPPPVPEPAPPSYSAGETFQDCEVCPEMVVVPAGSFEMGSTEAEIRQAVIGGSDRYWASDELPRHYVSVEQAFAVGKYEVTFSQWDACVPSGGCSHRPGDESWGRGNRPVINVSWRDAQEYVRWLSHETGHEYRLLSEAEWEYAARAGTQTARYWGDGVGHNNANCDGCGSRWDDEQTAPVGSFVPNAFGLHDMLGNVGEWTQDCYHGDYSGAPSRSIVWQGTRFCPHVLRGGSWDYVAGGVRSASRDGYSSSNRGVGFRVARTLF